MKTLFTTIGLLTIFAATSCRKDNAIVPSGANENLITDSSFESNGQPSFQGWTGQSKTYSFVNDVPTGGGQWSLQLEPCWFPCEGYAETFVTGFNGNYTFKLICDTKAINWTGQIILRKQNQSGTTIDLTKISFNNPAWTTVSLTTNVSLQTTDKLVVHLSAGGTEVANGQVLFDKINLQKQ